MQRITGRARLAGVIGYPVEHSRSPQLHNHWLARYAVDGAYLPLSVAPADLPVAGHALLLGAGGAARAVAAALLDRGLDVTITNRTAAHAEELALVLPRLRTIGWQHRHTALGDVDLVVNATSLGLAGDPTLAIDLAAADHRLVVADVVYAPRETPLLLAAARLGHRPIDGLGMLLHQARGGFCAWFGIDPDVDAALEAAVTGEAPPR